MKHKYLEYPECGCELEGHCMICDGALSVCTVCKGAEIELTTDCIGKPLTDNQRIGVANGDDYKEGKWELIYPHS